MGVLYPLKQHLIGAANRAGRAFGLKIEEYDPSRRPQFGNWQFYARLLERALIDNMPASEELGQRFVRYVVQHHKRSNSQFFQDLLVAFLLHEKQGGFFVEFGAANGIERSNTYMLERDY